MGHAATEFDSLCAPPVAPPPPARLLKVSTLDDTGLDRAEESDATAERQSVCDQMLAALEEEARAASAPTARLGAGRRLRIVGTGSEYRFAVGHALDVSRGKPAPLRLGGRDIEGAITGCGTKAMTIVLDEDVGVAVPDGAELVVDSPWLVHRLKERVRDVFELGSRQSALCNLDGALATLGLGEVRIAPHGPPCCYDNTAAPLEEEQERAVEVALRSSLSVVVAPPGTGKTVTLAAIAEAAYRAGLRVLVTAPSNAALDQLLLNIARRLEDEPGFSDALLLRIGDNASAELGASYGDRVVLTDVIRRLRPELHKRLAELQTRVDTLAAELTQAKARGADAAGRSTESGTIASLTAALTDARLALADCRSTVREYGRVLTSGARIVATTLTRSYLDRSLHGFDIALVDEVSMALTPAIFVAASLARHHVVLAGDPHQLAAPVRGDGVPGAWLREDVFRRLDVMDVLDRGEYVPYVTTLTVQRRSAEPLCALQRAIWYGDTLRTAPEVNARERARTNVIFDAEALCYIDTSALKPEAYRPWGRTYANRAHAALIADLVAYLDSAGEVAEDDALDGTERPEVLVMSHYRGQVAELSRQLKPWRNRGVAVRTVHRAQGSEATTAVLDLTLTGRQHTRSSGVFTATRPTDEGSRLLCVACSRARSRLVIVGDFAAIERSVSPRAVLGRIYTHLREHGHEILLDDILGTRVQLGLVPNEPAAPSRGLTVVR